MKITKPVLQNVRQEMDSALQEIAAKYGLSMKVGKISYDDDSFKAQVEASVVSNDGTNVKAKNDFGLYAYRYGLDASDFGATFKSGGKSYKIVGVKPRSPKFPILADCSDGKTYKLTPDMVKQGLGK